MSDVILVGSKKNAAILEFTRPNNTQYIYENKTTKEKVITNKDWVNWYNSRNSEPLALMHLIDNNNILAGILNTKIDFIVGRGVALYKENIVDVNGTKRRELVRVEDKTIQAWLADNNINEQLVKIATDDIYLGNFFVELIYNGKNQISKVNHIDATKCRKGKKENGNIKNIFVHDDSWTNMVSYKSKDANVKPFDAYINSDGKYKKSCIYAGSRYVPGYNYYAPAEWIGARAFIELANKIPVFHENGLEKGYNIRYHIKIPASYLASFGNEEQKRAAKEELRVSFDKALSGENNSGKSLITFFTNNGQLLEEWSIEPLDTNLNDEAFLGLLDKSHQAIISANGISPALCGIETQGKLSSGSEFREAYNIFLSLKTPRPRQRILSFLNEVKKINGWDKDIIFGIADVELTTLDNNPTGRQTIITNQID